MGTNPEPDPAQAVTTALKAETKTPPPLRKVAVVGTRQVWPTYREVSTRFGCPGNGGDPSPEWEGRCLTRLHLPYPMLTAWREPDPHTRVMKQRKVEYARVHREVGGSLGRILNAILREGYGGDIEELGHDDMDLFAGLYTYRASKRGAFLSLHGYGAALDFGAEKIPDFVVDLFKAEGWTWGGDFKDAPEYGHFEATKGK